MNIPDFTRYAKDQRSQVVGQSIAMPLTMTGFSFIGIAVTCGDDRRVRRADLGPGHARRAAARRPAGPARLRDGDRRDRADLDEHGGQRRLAVQRLLEPVAAPDLVPHRRPDHRGDRRDLVPVAALRGRRRLHLHLAGRLRQPARQLPRGDGVRLLAAAARAAERRGALPLRRRAASTGSRTASTGAR